MQANEAVKPYQIYIYCGYRTRDEQNELYKQGRTKPGKIVTFARAGESFHNYGHAIDYAFFNEEDKSVKWSDELYSITNKLAEKHGLRPLKFETCHLQNVNFQIPDKKGLTFHNGLY